MSNDNCEYCGRAKKYHSVGEWEAHLMKSRNSSDESDWWTLEEAKNILGLNHLDKD
jgi:hypothetical protein